VARLLECPAATGVLIQSPRATPVLLPPQSEAQHCTVWPLCGPCAPATARLSPCSCVRPRTPRSALNAARIVPNAVPCLPNSAVLQLELLATTSRMDMDIGDRRGHRHDSPQFEHCKMHARGSAVITASLESPSRGCSRTAQCWNGAGPGAASFVWLSGLSSSPAFGVGGNLSCASCNLATQCKW
jgi:hypothetical protein